MTGMPGGIMLADYSADGEGFYGRVVQNSQNQKCLPIVGEIRRNALPLSLEAKIPADALHGRP